MRRRSRARVGIRPEIIFESRDGCSPTACANSCWWMPLKTSATRTSTSPRFCTVQVFNFMNKLLTKSGGRDSKY